MITTLSGQISQLEDNAVILEIGGVGLRVFVPGPFLAQAKIGEIVRLQTHLVVREDALTLFGFETTGDRKLFTMLLGVDGVGPKVALSVLSTLDNELVQMAIHNNQEEIFNRVPGVGKKTAQKIILHLKDRLKPMNNLETIASMSVVDSDVLAALTALGYSVVEAQGAIQKIPRDSPPGVEDRLRIALQNI